MFAQSALASPALIPPFRRSIHMMRFSPCGIDPFSSDGETFKYILAFLRDGDDCPLPTDRSTLRRIEAEARYFGIQPLLTRLERVLRPMDRRDEPQAPRYFSAFVISNSTYGTSPRV